MNCINCGSPLLDGARFCTCCGAENKTVDAPVSNSFEAPVEEVAAPVTQSAPKESVYYKPNQSDTVESAETMVLSADQVPPATMYRPDAAPTQAPTTTGSFAPPVYQDVSTYQPATPAPQAEQPKPETAVPAVGITSRPANQMQTTRGLGKMIGFSLITFGIYAITQWSTLVDDLNLAACRYDGRKNLPYFAACFCTAITGGIFAFVWMHNLSNRMGAELKRRGINYSVGAKDFWLWSVLGSLILVGPYIYVHKMLKSMNLISENYNMYG